MSNIEKAVLRLEQLRQAGIEVPNLAKEPAELSESLENRSGGQTVSDAEAGAPPGKSERSHHVDIDLPALAAAGYITPDSARARIADEFRVIKRPIIKNAHAKSGTRIAHGNRVMVTSALPGEGKTFVAINLALSIALEVDNTVLLVDADVANPCVAKVMHLPGEKGLMDLLMDDRLTVGDLLLTTNVDKLSLLEAGTSHPRATEMLASRAMADLVNEMSARYPDRILVFDSPPLLVTTEARALAAHMGQIIMVVESDRTSQTAVTRALETIEMCPTVMMLLNKTQHSEIGSYYGYGYGYPKYPATR